MVSAKYHEVVDTMKSSQRPQVTSESKLIAVLCHRLYRNLLGRVPRDPEDAVQDHLLWLLEHYQEIPSLPFRYHLICAQRRNIRKHKKMKREQLMPNGWEPDAAGI
jgi:DNA-directed RNA polymerase specialized sigma24 family protein